MSSSRVVGRGGGVVSEGEAMAAAGIVDESDTKLSRAWVLEAREIERSG